MGFSAFLLAVLGLLFAPGPTNTMLALAGAQGDVRLALRLIPAALLGYLSALLPLAVGAGVIVKAPLVAILVQVAAAVWVLVLAARLWTSGSVDQDSNGVTAGQVYLTTLLNPKALVAGLVLLPPVHSPDFFPRITAFLVTAGLVGAGWCMAGSTIGRSRRSAKRLDRFRRFASIWLGLVSGSLFFGVWATLYTTS